MEPHQFSIEWDNQLPRPASYDVLDVPHDSVGPFGCQGLLLTHIQLVNKLVYSIVCSKSLNFSVSFLNFQKPNVMVSISTENVGRIVYQFNHLPKYIFPHKKNPPREAEEVWAG